MSMTLHLAFFDRTERQILLLLLLNFYSAFSKSLFKSALQYFGRLPLSISGNLICWQICLHTHIFY